MFERFCVLLLRLYPSEFRRAYGHDAAQLIRDRARHERGFVKRVRLLIDLSADLFAISLRGWHAARPLLANVTSRDGTPRFDIIEVSGPRPEALAIEMLMSTLMFASFALLFQSRPFPPAPVQLGDGSASAPAGFESGGSAEPLIATIAENLKQRCFDRAVGQQLADALLAHDKNGAFDQAQKGLELATCFVTVSC
jgi:hypothetical protein